MFTTLLTRFKAQPALTLAFLQALAATLGSLYFSEIWGMAPCKLCWFQRIFMYPLVFILPLAIYHQDKKIIRYTLPLSLTGLTIAVYHTVIYTLTNYLDGVNEFILTSCSGVSCTQAQLDFLGFINIPLLSALAFLFISAMLWLHQKSRQPFWKFW
jgi:disulfide bond formation protein DsbB